MISNGKNLSSDEKPQNGLAGLKHWRYDLRSGVMVAMISLPFSMGIAITSGAPPVCGIVSAIVAGLVLPFLGGSYVTISGPAAGLAPALFSGMVLLGSTQLHSTGSDGIHPTETTAEFLKIGYPLILVAICLAGLFQVVLAKLKVARLSAIFPAAAIEGMLAAIGLMIIAKQLPLFMGVKFHAHEFWTILEEVPHHFPTLDWRVLALGVACVAALFALASIPSKLLKVMPPPVWVFGLGTLVNVLLFHLGPEHLIQLPEAPLKHGIVLPHFSEAFGNWHLWLPLAYITVTLLLIDGTESLATIAAVDRLDPYRRRSDPDRTLLSMGVSNICSSGVGGLTIIPGIVKSTANIMGGGRTQWANFYNALFLLGFLVLGRGLINKVPTAVLAAILFYVGFKLCRPRVWKHVAGIGLEQLLVFTVTVLVTVSTDLLIGIIAGVLLKLLFCLWHVSLWSTLKNGVADQQSPRFGALLASLFRNPVERRDVENGTYCLYVARPLVCFNLFHLLRELGRRPEGTHSVAIRVSKDVPLIDHTTNEALAHTMEELKSVDGVSGLVVEGWEHLKQVSPHKTSTRIGLAAVLVDASERLESEPEEMMAATD